MSSLLLEFPLLPIIILSLTLGIVKLYLIITLGICRTEKRLDGKTVIITGANTGIGKETALELAFRGARIILACRNIKKAKKAKEDIVTATGNGEVFVAKLDLASLSSVRKFAANILKNEEKLHILINNAGCAGIDKKLTVDGLEDQMQSNYFGHFLLTNLLLALMIKTAEREAENGRIINVSSMAHHLCWNLNFDDINFLRDPRAGSLWFPFKIYGASKLCNILFSTELARKLEFCGKSSVTVNSLHPGAVFTEFGRFSKLFSAIMNLSKYFLKTAKEGAQTTIYLAVADELNDVTGLYFSDCKVVNTSKLAKDAEVARKLWKISETIVRLKPNETFFYETKKLP